jgi:hypothetical protein
MNTFAVIMGIMTLFIIGTILSFSVEGEFGIAATSLTTTLDNNDLVVEVADTTGFLTLDFIVIGEENICYTGKTATTFTGVTRGCQDTGAEGHAAGVSVYNEGSNVVNSLIGFNIAEAMSTAGVIRVPFMLATTVPRTFAKIISWDYSYLEGSLWTVPLVYVKFVLFYPLSGAFMISFIIMMVNVFMGVARLFTP